MTSSTTPQDASARSTAAYWEHRYLHGETPWDTGVVPPELYELLDSGQLRPPGVTLDLGCGTGTNVNYLASLGFTAFGVDFSWRALVEARHKALQAGLPARFFVGDVARLPLGNLRVDFALDMGCLHGLDDESRQLYAQALARLMAPGGLYMLYGFDSDPAGGSGARGFAPGEIAARFAPHFDLLWQRPSFQGDRPVAWYLLRRR